MDSTSISLVLDIRASADDREALEDAGWETFQRQRESDPAKWRCVREFPDVPAFEAASSKIEATIRTLGNARGNSMMIGAFVPTDHPMQSIRMAPEIVRIAAELDIGVEVTFYSTAEESE